MSNDSMVFRTVVMIMVCIAAGACARRTAAPIDDRRPGIPMPPSPPPVASKLPAPLPPVAPPSAPAEPEIQVKPIGAPGAIETRPLGAPGSTPPTVAVPPTGLPTPRPGAVTGERPDLKTEPRAFKAPYSDENLAIILRGEDPRRVPAKPEAKPPAAEVKPPPTEAKPAVADIKPEAAAPPQAAAGEAGAVDWTWPAPGRVIETFESNTKGLGIAGRVGEPVVAAAGGRVIFSGNGPPGYGQLVIVKHNEPYLSAYAHNSRILVKEGQTVTKGQKIAEIGSTDTDRPKLHFEIRRSGKPVDPIAHLPVRR
ncbi:MAG: murein hydrolase activator EnvC family protein [Burkholderiales bacterium]